MPKATTPVGRQGRLHNPLEDDLTATGLLKSKSGKRKSRHEDEGEKYVDSKASRKILRIGQELADEAEAENPVRQRNTAFDFESRLPQDEDEEEPYEDAEEWGDEEEVEEIDIAPDDLETYNKFFPTEEDPLLRQGWPGQADDVEEAEQGTDLTALILEKIAAFEAAQETRDGEARGARGLPEDGFEVHPKVLEVYSKIGLILSRYKAGKLPKPFKILPTVPHWEDIIEITRPDKWTANACYEATKIFVSSTPVTAQRFMEMILLERVREDIRETKRLNVHLFNALKKGLYKPAAWFKGFLFPLVGSGTCTLREANIISGVLVRVSVPVLHSAAAIKGLCDIAAQESSAGTEGGGATNIFIKALLEKKYALPYQVIDSLVFHFMRFKTTDPANARPEDVGAAMEGVTGGKETKLPVIWHQCLLVFAQRYRNDITEDQREALLDLLLTKGHSAIGPEVRRELLEGRVPLLNFYSVYKLFTRVGTTNMADGQPNSKGLSEPSYAVNRPSEAEPLVIQPEEPHADSRSNTPPPYSGPLTPSAPAPAPRSQALFPGLPKLDYALYSPPHFSLSSDHTLLKTYNPRLSTYPVALLSTIKALATVPPKPQIRIRGRSSDCSVDFDIKLNMINLILAEDRKWNYVKVIGDGEMGFRGDLKESTVPRLESLEQWARMYCEDGAPIKYFALERTVINWDTSYLEGRLLSLVSSTAYRGHVTVSFPMSHHKVMIHSPDIVNHFFSSVTKAFTGTKKYEVLKSMKTGPHLIQQSKPFVSIAVIMAILESLLEASLSHLLLTSLFMSTILLLTHTFYNLFLSPLSSIPGPLIAKITPFWLYHKTYIGTESRTLYSLHQKYGPLLRIAPHYISISSGSAIAPIYITKGGFPKSQCYSNFDIDAHATIFSTTSPLYRNLRAKAVLPLFSMKSLRENEGQLYECVDNMVQKMKREKESIGRINLLNFTRGLAVDVVSTHLFLQNYNGTSEKGGRLSVSAFVDSFVAVGRFFYLPNWLFRFLEWAISICVSDDKTARSAEIVNQYVDHLVDGTKEEDMNYPGRLKSIGIEVTEIKAQCKDLIFAGTDSTGMNLASLCRFLVLFPEKYECLRTEILKNSSLGPRKQELQSLPYLSSILKESMRLAMANPSLLPHTVPSPGWTFQDSYFPAGTMVGCSAYSLHLDPIIFPSPHAFIPERWINESPERKEEMTEYSFGFGAGSRACIARNLAMMELYMGTEKIVESDVLRGARVCEEEVKIWEWFNSSVRGAKIEVTWEKRE
ncbi:hypothetical protein B7494_g4342 [Chlorociboria aeruginascens]|nr:hypothetical protein B7494_g4342 [Chlorociboria aeruginascens]